MSSLNVRGLEVRSIVLILDPRFSKNPPFQQKEKHLKD